MARRKVKKRRSVRRKKTTRYFKEGTQYASGNKIFLPADLGAMERRKKTFAGSVRNFTEKYLWPAYNGFLAEINNARDDPDEQRRIFADYVQLSNNDTHAKQILDHYTDTGGNLDWDRFVADVSSQDHLFNPDILTVDTNSKLTEKNKVTDVPLKAQVLRRLAIRHQDPSSPETTYNLDEQIQKGASDVILPKYITDVYGTLMGNTHIAKNKLSQSKADTVLKKYMGDVYKRKYNIDKPAERTLKRIFHGRKEKNLGEMIEWAKQNPKEFASLIEYDKIQNPNYGYKKDSLFSKITQRPWIEPEGFDVDKKSNKYDESLAIDINKKLGLKQGSMNPISVALAMKYNELKTEDGMENEEIIKELMGKDLEVEYIERAKKAMGKKRVNAKPLKEKAKMLGVTIKGTLYDTNKTSSKKKTKDSKSKFSTGGSGGGSSYGKAPGIKGFLSRDVAKKTSSGQTVYRKQSGILKDMQKKIDKKVKQRIRPTPKQRKSYFEKYFGEEYPREFIDDAKRGMEKGNWFRRRLIEHEAKRMAVDEKYKAEKTAKKIEDRGIALARETRARQRAEAVQKAATSPWYAAWYRFSLVTKWIIIIGITAAVLFLPIGMFHVLGWALAVGVVAVIQFIIWVFMEIWFLLAQTIVMLVSFVGQGFSFIVNWIGRGFGDLTGGEYQDTTYTDVQNMLMFDKVGDGIFAAATYEDTEGARQFLTWGALNLVPPNFLKLDSFKPDSFNTNTLISYVIPPLQDFFHWVYDPIANRYTNWMVTLPPDQWYWPGVIIGVPVILAIIGAVLAYRYLIRQKSFFV